MFDKSDWVGLLAWVGFALLVPAALVRRKAIGYSYRGLVKPFLAPPGWLFPVAWTLVYALSGIASFMAWRAGPGESWDDREGTYRDALGLYVAQHLCMSLWPALFFSRGWVGVAFFDIVTALSLAIPALVFFVELDVLAGALFVPCLVWQFYVACVNMGIWYLNGAFLPSLPVHPPGATSLAAQSRV